MQVIGVAGISYDLVLQVDQFPTVDSKTTSKFAGQFPGGFIANATTAIATLGVTTGYVGWVGQDDAGKMLHDEFVAHQIDTSGLRLVAGETTPFTVIMLNPQGERIILLPQFPLYHQQLDNDQRDYLQTADVVYSYPDNLAWCQTLYDCVQGNHGKLVLDIEHSHHLSASDLRDIIRMTTICFVSDGVLAKLGVSSLADIESNGWIIHTQGASGAEGYSTESGLIFEPARKVNVVDTTGAGDCFHSGVVASYIWGDNLAQALKFATVATSLKIQHLGARNGLPTRQAVLNYY